MRHSAPSRLLPLLAAAYRRVRGHARGLTLAVSATLALVMLSATPATAYAPVDIVHTEQVDVGPYKVTVGFSEWPLRAMQSLDFSFIPEDGIAGKSGTLTIDGPGLDPDDREEVLSRHPRQRDVWGLDIYALPEPGTWDLTFEIDGAAGQGRGTLKDITVLDQPGPPLALSWTVVALPSAGMLAFLAVGWRRNRPGERVDTVVRPTARTGSQ
ncbi:hypothetical protein ACFSUJ_30505 [Streptomyces lusitanus]|uniref:Uncharacterized protein n=1 Tax=Streptomyces lusitanus TaxID=68232 RepID=A0ABU3JNN0_9ACTN|nr:hypothetical protein [Streptomyces lusitanus]